jgi:biopolymer transport protein ExbD
MQRFKRNMPTVNATSSADIAFILLLFFLLAGSFNPDEGIFHRLLPDTARSNLKKKRDIERRNVLTFVIRADNTVLMENVPVSVPEIRSTAKFFIANPENLENLPEKTVLNISGLGEFEATANAVIMLEVSREASYEIYLEVFGELMAAYDDLRNELAYRRFDKSFSRLTMEQQTAVREAYPVRIAEKESEVKEVSHE